MIRQAVCGQLHVHAHTVEHGKRHHRSANGHRGSNAHPKRSHSLRHIFCFLLLRAGEPERMTYRNFTLKPCCFGQIREFQQCLFAGLPAIMQMYIDAHWC